MHKYCSDHLNVIDLLDTFVSPFFVALVMPLAREILHSYMAKSEAEYSMDHI